MILFSKPYISKTEERNVLKVLRSGVLTDGFFQNKTERLIKKKINSNYIALTQSCTDALELASLLIDLKPNDEVIMPSYTFTSTANAVVLRNAKPVFIDIKQDDMCIDERLIENKITKKTKAIYVVHYGGKCINLNQIIKIKKKYKLYLIEDAAHSFLSSYKNKYAGTFGDIGVFSFHETKNIVGSQGGAISVNNKKLINRTNYLLDKGTDRSNFLKNYKKQYISEKNKKRSKKYYSWVDLGSEFRATELVSAMVYSQLLKEKQISFKRKKIWNLYNNFFKNLKHEKISLLGNEKKYHKNSYHLFILKIKSIKLASKLRAYLQKKSIPATFHYVPLHLSKYGKKFKRSKMEVTNRIWKNVIRLPIYPELKENQIEFIKNKIFDFFQNN